jgi:hypothetical protein
MSEDFFKKLKEFVDYVEELEQKFRFAKYHILVNIDKFSVKEIECMILDHIFTDEERKEVVLDLLKKGLIDRRNAKLLLFVTEEELEKLLAGEAPKHGQK